MKVVRNIAHAAILAAVAATLVLVACSNSSDGSIPAPVPVLPPPPAPNEPVDPALTIPLTLEAAVAGATVTFNNKAAGHVNYKVNGGTAQTIASGTSKAITLDNVGDKVQFFGDNKTYQGSGSSNIACSEDCYIYGNIMSLIKSSNFESATTLEEKSTFSSLFKNNAHIKNKNGADLLLPATTLTESCYYGMFEGCANLAAAPMLPATTLAESCYCSMFDHCTNLTKAPELPAAEIFYNCYAYMFYFCENLASAPELPATEMKEMCYHTMFTGCKKLTAAPALPATKLAKKCYTTMFALCENLESAPELPAETLVEGCYSSMFLNCAKLSSVTCLATDISALDCTNNWLSDVALTGTFKKATGMTAWQIGSYNGIPSGWTIEDYQPSQQ
ncbi:MAG: hypothetical protein J6V90_01730 [Treponema sp.]|nr:hypothetical protein [Treponema sp.]